MVSGLIYHLIEQLFSFINESVQDGHGQQHLSDQIDYFCYSFTATVDLVLNSSTLHALGQIWCMIIKDTSHQSSLFNHKLR